jgi:hypothetical protein
MDLRIKATVVNSIGVSLVLSLSLYLWRIWYSETDLAAVLLIPVAALIFMGSLWSSTAVYRANIRVAVREASPFYWLLTGRLRAFAGAIVFTNIAIILLAWYAISSTYPELLLLVFQFYITSLFFARSEQRLLEHLTPAFARTTALITATFFTSLLFIPLLAWANWNFTPQPIAIRSASLEEALQLGFGQLPPRRGWIAELMAPFYALEYVKLWFVVQADAPKWFSFWYSIDTALISIFAARVSAVVMSAAQMTRGSLGESKSNQ